MKKALYFFLPSLTLLYLGLSIFSCKKTATPKPVVTLTKTQLLTAHPLKETEAEYGSTVADLMVIPLNSIETQETLSFTATGNDTGAFTTTIIGTVVSTGTWALVNNETQLQFTIPANAANGISAQSYTTSITFNADSTIVLLFSSGPSSYVDNSGTQHTFAVFRETLTPTN